MTKSLEEISYHDIDGHFCYIDSNCAKEIRTHILSQMKEKGLIYEDNGIYYSGVHGDTDITEDLEKILGDQDE